jgi:hypothetical protein
MTESPNIGKLKQFFFHIIASNLPPDTDLEVLRKIYLLNLIILLGTIFLTLLGLLAFAQKAYMLFAADFLILLFLVWLFFYLRRTSYHSFVILIGTATTGIFYLFLVAHGGVSNTAFLWVYTYPLVALFLLGSRLGSLASFLLLGLMCIVFALGGSVTYFASYSVDLILRFTTSYITVTLFAFVMERVRLITQNRLRISNTRLGEAVESLEKAHREKDNLILELQQTIDEVKTLKGIIPICASCKKIRDDSGYWQQVEQYVKNHSNAEFSHGICPECAKVLYPDLYDNKD